MINALIWCKLCVIFYNLLNRFPFSLKIIRLLIERIENYFLFDCIIFFYDFKVNNSIHGFNIIVFELLDYWFSRFTINHCRWDIYFRIFMRVCYDLLQKFVFGYSVCLDNYTTSTNFLSIFSSLRKLTKNICIFE